VIWFTSDLHFGHSNIIKYCERPFKDAEEMNKALIKNWNARVAADDTVYVLGDFSFMPPGPTKGILQGLKGKKHLVAGNHDSNRVRGLEEWESVQDYLEVGLHGKFFVMMHYPIESWNKHLRGSVHLHGHTHGSDRHGGMEPRRNRFDVGIDAWNYQPVSIDEILTHVV
jgi:calcineurin-like phosphoesterase family protein